MNILEILGCVALLYVLVYLVSEWDGIFMFFFALVEILFMNTFGAIYYIVKKVLK